MNGLFDFTFQDIAGFLVAFIPGLVSLGLFIYILLFLPRTRLTNIFTLLTLCFIFWQMDDAMGRIVTTAHAADAWDCIFAPAWIFVAPLCLHFSLLYTGILKIGRGLFQTLLLYIPAFIFLTLYQGHFYPHLFEYNSFWGWRNDYAQSVTDRIQTCWIALLVIAAAVLLFVHTYKVRNDHILKYQSLFISLGIAIPTVSGIITQVIFPLVFRLPAMPIASTFMTFFSLATVIGLKKYRLFSISDLVSSEMLIETLPVIVFSIAGKNRITYMNGLGAEVLGIKKEEAGKLDYTACFRFGSARHEQNFREALEQALKGQQVRFIESSLITTTGKMDVLLSSRPIINNNDIQGALFAARDITELKKTNRLLERKEALLEEAQRLSHLGSWEWDMRTRKATLSDELYRIFGYTEGEIAVSYDSYLQRVVEDEKEIVDRIVKNAYYDHRLFNYYNRINKKDGSISIIFVRGKFELDEQGRIGRIYGTVQDVTDINAKEQRLQKQNEELKKINSELDKFVYSVSHDLRAPLMSMLGLIHITEEETAEPATLEHLSLLKQTVKRLDNFILDILHYSRNARTETAYETIDFNALLTGIMQDLRDTGETEPRANICTDVEGSVAFRSDKSRLNVILSNLIANAIRYKDPKVLKPFVNIKVTVSEKEAHIAVSDNGIGISRSQQGKIFEMFYRASKSSIGSGLGLYIVKETVKKLEGRITVESDLGKGARFEVWLPNN